MTQAAKDHGISEGIIYGWMVKGATGAPSWAEFSRPEDRRIGHDPKKQLKQLDPAERLLELKICDPSVWPWVRGTFLSTSWTISPTG